MAIKKISDLQVGNEYFACWSKDSKSSFKILFLGFLNEFEGKTELYFAKPPKKIKSTNLVYANEIGIGESKEEALKNYEKFNYEAIASAYTSQAELKAGTRNWLKAMI